MARLTWAAREAGEVEHIDLAALGLAAAIALVAVEAEATRAAARKAGQLRSGGDEGGEGEDDELHVGDGWWFYGGGVVF
jgi:hypothetical protein